MSHSPEPWKSSPYSGSTPAFRMFTVTDGKGETFVAAVGGEDVAQAIANSERIAACVNFCNGLSTYLLTQYGEGPNRFPAREWAANLASAAAARTIGDAIRDDVEPVPKV